MSSNLSQETSLKEKAFDKSSSALRRWFKQLHSTSEAKPYYLYSRNISESLKNGKTYARSIWLLFTLAEKVLGFMQQDHRRFVRRPTVLKYRIGQVGLVLYRCENQYKFCKWKSSDPKHSQYLFWEEGT